MKSTLTICSLLFFMVANAQKFNYFIVSQGPLYNNSFNKNQPNRIKLKGVKEQEDACYNIKGEIAWKYVNTYNSTGRVTSNTYYKKNKLKRVYYNLYLNDTLVFGNVYLNGKGDTIHQGRYEYGANGKASGHIYSYKGKSSETRYEYDAKGNREKTIVYRKGKLKWTYTYRYNEEGKMLQSLQYNSRNKLVRQTTYQCDYRGEIVSAEVKQTNMCIHKDSSQNNGGYIVYDDRTDEKGRLARSIYRYDKDTNMVSYESFNKKGELTGKQYYSYDAAGNNISRKVFRKNKLWFSYEYSYNDNALLSLSNYISKTGEVKAKQVYQYKYF